MSAPLSGDPPAIEPLVVEFDVPAPPEHAFDVWVSRAELWWPPGHTITGSPAAIVFEPRVGGRIYERDGEGGERAWGEVLHWEPPTRIRYLWHLFFPRSEATEVDITFTPSPDGTRFRLVQTGWDALADEGPVRRERTFGGWAEVTDPYRQMLRDHPTDEPIQGEPR